MMTVMIDNDGDTVITNFTKHRSSSHLIWALIMLPVAVGLL